MDRLLGNILAIASAAMTLTLRSPNNKTLLEVALSTNRFGIAAYNKKSGPQLDIGDYTVSFNIESSSDFVGEALDIVLI